MEDKRDVQTKPDRRHALTQPFIGVLKHEVDELRTSHPEIPSDVLEGGKYRIELKFSPYHHSGYETRYIRVINGRVVDPEALLQGQQLTKKPEDLISCKQEEYDKFMSAVTLNNIFQTFDKNLTILTWAGTDRDNPPKMEVIINSISALQDNNITIDNVVYQGNLF